MKRALYLAWCVAAAGCADQICPDRAPALYQVSPTGRAVAIVDPEIFDNVFNWIEQNGVDPNTSFDCLIDYFTARYANDADIIFVVLNLSREEFLSRSRNKIIANFTVTQRTFESGLGGLRFPLLAPVGPPSMRSYSFLGTREGILNGPSLHEIAHAWSAYLDGPPVLSDQVQREPTSHWGFSSVGGVLGGWAPGGLQALGGEQYRACGPSAFEPFAPQGYANNSIPYAPLELYLMGLVSADEVPDIQVAVNPVATQTDEFCTIFFADGLQSVTIADIIAANGARRPGVQESQKHFNLALMVLAEQRLEPVDWLIYEEAMRCLESTQSCGQAVSGLSTSGQTVVFQPLTFFEATGGRASLRFMTLEPVDPAAPGSGELEVTREVKSMK